MHIQRIPSVYTVFYKYSVSHWWEPKEIQELLITQQGENEFCNFKFIVLYFYVLLYMYQYQTRCYRKKSILETCMGLAVPDRDIYSLITVQGLFTILYPISPHYILSLMKCHFLKALELKHCCASKRKSAVSSVQHPHAR